MKPETLKMLEHIALVIKRERDEHRAELAAQHPELEPDDLSYVDDMDSEIRTATRHMLKTIGLDDLGGCRLCLG